MTMNILHSIRIEGLWGNPDSVISLDFDSQFNFLIGQNGSGKTTIVNLIAATLSADFEQLDKTQFSRIEIILKTKGSSKRPSILVTKSPKHNAPYFDINYEIKRTASTKPVKFDLDAIAEERAFRGIPPRVLRERLIRQRFLDIEKELGSLVTSSWLSVNRHSDDDEHSPEDRKQQLSFVDRKLASLSNSLVRYFSQLSKKYADNTLEFQKNSFLSLLTSEKEGQLINFSQRIDVDEERRTLSNVFELLGLESRQYEKKLNTHLEQFSSSLNSFNQKKATGSGQLSTIEFAAMYNAWKAHSLVQHYEALQQKKREIFELRDKFVQIMNELLNGRKTLVISERNDLVFSTRDGREIKIEDLSSGEKQLLIILGEALLQEQSPVVYIADEPELSLHVTWQEQLTNVLIRLNPNAQIIFATHSPDIVGIHTDKIQNMEAVLG